MFFVTAKTGFGKRLGKAFLQWEELCVLNPAVIYNELDKKYYMLYRAAGNDKTHLIYIGLAISDDGINFVRQSDKPLISPNPNGLDAGGCEDPRLIKMGDYFYLTYASRPFPPGQYWREDKEYFGFQPEFGPKVLVYNNTLTHLAISKDLINWKKLGPITDPHFDDRDAPWKSSDHSTLGITVFSGGCSSWNLRRQ